MSVILGIDPGTNITGYGIINSENNKLSYIHHEIIKTGLKNLYTTKLSLIHKNTQRLIELYKPDEIALESVFFSVNAGTAIKLGEEIADELNFSKEQFKEALQIGHINQINIFGKCEFKSWSNQKNICGRIWFR